MSTANIEISNVAHAIVVSVRGSIGMVELEQFDAQLSRIAEGKPAVVVLEMSGVAVMGSSAMGSLVGFRRDIAKSGGAVLMAGVSPVVRESFKRALLDKLFKIYDTVQTAIDSTPARR